MKNLAALDLRGARTFTETPGLQPQNILCGILQMLDPDPELGQIVRILRGVNKDSGQS